MNGKHYDARVFRVKEPLCAKCHEPMDFKLYADFNGSGLDWLQWYCTQSSCGYYFNVEII